jgi:hypothetical protein
MRAIAALFTASLLVSCSNTVEPGSSETPPAPVEESGCELLTDGEVSAATDAPVSGHEEASLDGCRWRAQGGMTLMLDVYAGSTLAPATCRAQQVLGVGREEAVAGLGDSAQWKTSGSLVVCTTRAVIRFNLDNSARTVPENKEGLIKLARLVLDRL